MSLVTIRSLPRASIAWKASRPQVCGGHHRKLAVVVRADASGKINLSIRKDEEKVADFMKVSELPSPKCVVCRCWRSAKFPMCDGAHVKHNKETGDNVGPFVITNDVAPAKQ